MVGGLNPWHLLVSPLGVTEPLSSFMSWRRCLGGPNSRIEILKDIIVRSYKIIAMLAYVCGEPKAPRPALAKVLRSSDFIQI
jgi:hypothetical protein